MTPIRWGILGAGAIAASFCRDLAMAEGSRAVAVGARDANRAAAFAAEHGFARSYGSYQHLVQDPDVDVIYVATTNAQHRDHALLALRAGKPVLVEKAFALNAHEAREVVVEAGQRELFCMEAMWMRFNPLIRQALALVTAGRIGEVQAVRADLSKRFEYDPTGRLFDLAAGGGALLDLGVYAATLAWLVLGRPDTVQATGRLAPTGSDLIAAQQWGYRDGRSAQLYCSAAGDSPYGALITGSAGWLRLENRLHHPSAITVHTDGADDNVIAETPPAGNGFGPEIVEVERCLRAGLTESPAVPLQETVAILELLDQARRQIGVRYPTDKD